MKRLPVIILTILLVFTIITGAALAQDTIIESTIQDDLFITGNSVIINAPVIGDVFVGGGTVKINANITGDVFAVGGIIEINAPITGDLISAGAQIIIKQNVTGKIIAAGGLIELQEDTTKVLIAAGSVTLFSTTNIEQNAYLFGGTVNNQATIEDTLIVRAATFQNSGTAQIVDYQTSQVTQIGETLKGIFRILQIVIVAGYMILGLLILKFMPNQFLALEEELNKSKIKNTAVGFLLLILTTIVSIILAVTVIGLPISILLTLTYLIALIISPLIVSLTIGKTIVNLLKRKTSNTILFIIGFIALHLLYLIPFIGFIFVIGALSLGLGAIFYTTKKNLNKIISLNN